MRIEEKAGELVITDFDEIETYKIACRIETDGIHFYKRLLDNTKDEKAKTALAMLLTEEEEHLRSFESLLLEARERQEDKSEEEDLLEGIDYGIFQPYESMDQLSKVLDTPSKVLKLGVIVEDKGIKFYETCKEHVINEETKKALSKIIDEEYKHKKLFEDMLSKIRK
jgi:rubrerythrin